MFHVAMGITEAEDKHRVAIAGIFELPHPPFLRCYAAAGLMSVSRNVTVHGLLMSLPGSPLDVPKPYMQDS